MSSIIQELVSEDSLVLYHDYRAGHAKDLSGQGNDGVISGGFLCPDGLIHADSADVTTVSDNANLQLATGSIFVLVDLQNMRADYDQVLVSKRDAGGTNYALSIDKSTQKLIFYDGSNSRSSTSTVLGAKSLGATFATNYAAIAYMDGVSDGAFDGASTVTVDDADLTIGGIWTSNYQQQNPIGAVVIVNRILSEGEMARLHGELVNRKWPTTIIGDSPGVYGPELVSDGDMEAANVDSWDAYAGATINKQWRRVLDGLRVLRATNTLGYGGARQTILEVGKTYRVNGWARGNGTSVPSLYVGSNTVAWTGTSSTSWQYFDVVATADAYAFVTLYNTGAATNYVEFDNVSVREVIEPEIQFKTEWGVYASGVSFTAGQIENSPIQVTSGTWKIITDTIEGETCKVLECVADGFAFIDSSYIKGDSTQDAYGTWEFYFSKDSSSYPAIYFVAANPNNGQLSYDLYWTDTQWFGLDRSQTQDLFTTAAGTVTADTYYKYTITRRHDGQFTVYLNDVLVTVDTGANPVTNTVNTTSKYITLELDAGDKLALAGIIGERALIKRRGVV
jgi:hypothetical protein